jgi:ribosomal protein S18 acetylase RimI-like enzyme
VHPSNEAAIRLYRGLGFYEVGRVGSRWLKS